MSKKVVKPIDVVKVSKRLQDFDEDCGDVITNLKAQKLAYYAQGVSYAMLGTPLFDDDFEAWLHGPVIPSLYDELKQFENRQIEIKTDYDDKLFSKEQLDVIVRTYKTFGQYSAWKLRDMTHQELPWKNTKRNQVISKELIRSYFMAKYAKTT